MLTPMTRLANALKSALPLEDVISEVHINLQKGMPNFYDMPNGILCIHLHAVSQKGVIDKFVIAEHWFETMSNVQRFAIPRAENAINQVKSYFESHGVNVAYTTLL